MTLWQKFKSIYKKKYSHNFCLVLLGSGISISIVICVDLLFGVSPSTVAENFQNIPESYKALDLPIKIPPRTYLEIPKESETSEEMFYDSFNIDKKTIYKLLKNGSSTKADVVVINSKTGEPLFQWSYLVDESWRRVGSKTHSPKKEIAIVYIGCSFTFGDGVNDDETFVAQSQKLANGVDHVNLGLSSFGLNDIYAHLEIDGYVDPVFKNTYNPVKRYLDLPYKKIILVYYFIGDHLFRSQCSQRCLYTDESIVLDKPYFELKGDKLIHKGSHRNRIDNYFFYLLSKSNFLKSQNLDIPDAFSKKNIKRHHLFLDGIRKKYAERFEIIDSYTIYNPFEPYEFAKKVELGNKSKNFKPIFFNRSELLKKYGIANLLIKSDGHLAPLAHKVISAGLIWHITHDHPKIVKSER